MTQSSPYLPAEISAISPDEITSGFWESCARRQLSIQQCTHCKTFRHLPTPSCPKCRSFDWQYTPVSGKGTIFSYTIAHHPVVPLFADKVPYNVVLVNLDDAPVRLVSNLVGIENDQIKIGMPVEVTWEEPIPGTVIPRFRPRSN